MKMRNFVFIHISLLIITVLFSTNPWPYSMLTIAQLVYIPIVLKLVIEETDWLSKLYVYIAIPTYVSVFLLQVTSSSLDWLFAGIYFLFTIVIACYGLTRFLTRGFTHVEEFMIDAGLMYLAMGGGWFFAYIIGIDMGFSPLITWLTAIHFHYSAFLLPIFIGFIGRLYQSSLYKWMAFILLASPLIVAIGITFFRWIELLSVVSYIVGLYGFIYLTLKVSFANKWQKWLVTQSFLSLCVTIIFSLLYALGNGFGLTSVNIDFMLRFHGVLNCLIFAATGVIGWAINTPPSLFKRPTFPISNIRGKIEVQETVQHRGLVDDMRVYEPFINYDTLPTSIIDFYENTVDYKLLSTVKWHSWFKPFAYVYKLISHKTEQINLPLHDEEIEMTGGIYTLDQELDGREHVRVWLREVQNEKAFLALYSQHTTNERVYMNIALPLPFSSMIGILELSQIGDTLQLTSEKSSSASSDAGIYLATKNNHLFTLPFTEKFIVKELNNRTLRAKHQLWIFSIPFLTINYTIVHKPFMVG